jgi:tetratricopeptide (TPR) repeat protein
MDSETQNLMQAAFKEGRYEEALAIAERYLSEVDGYDWQCLIMKANIKSLPDPTFSDYFTAVGLAFFALDLDRSDTERWVAVAAVCDGCGLYGEAERCYRTALKMEPDNYYALMGLVYVRSCPGTSVSESEVRGFLEKAIKVKPDEWIPYHHLAQFLKAAGDNQPARAMYHKALEAYPQDKGGDRMHQQITEELNQLDS